MASKVRVRSKHPVGCSFYALVLLALLACCIEPSLSYHLGCECDVCVQRVRNTSRSTQLIFESDWLGDEHSYKCGLCFYVCKNARIDKQNSHNDTRTYDHKTDKSTNGRKTMMYNIFKDSIPKDSSNAEQYVTVMLSENHGIRGFDNFGETGIKTFLGIPYAKPPIGMTNGLMLYY